MRWIFLVHRYLGIGLCLLMALWCLSGFVMMYVPYPALSPAQRLQGLPPLDLSRCCTLNRDSLADGDPVGRFEVEMLGSRPILRLYGAGGQSLIDLTDGRTLGRLSAADAQGIALAFAHAENIPGEPRLLGRIDYDQWTVSGEFNRARPLFEFALDDPRGTQLYVSSVSGKVVQVTTQGQRIGNWFGAVPHWLYFAKLRRNARVWTQVVDWLSLAGCFLTVIGLYIGVRQFLRRPIGHWSGYRGALFWHHVPGLFFGILLLTWVASGLISMSPWGFLDSDGGEAQMILQARPASGAQVRTVLQWLPRLTGASELVAVESASVLDSLYLLTTNRGGVRARFNAAGQPAAVDRALWARISHLLSPGPATRSELLLHGDAYVYAAPGQESRAVYRIIGDDPQHTRYYFDPATAHLSAVFDANARWYRWLMQGLHSLDFSAALRTRPGWDLLMIVLLTGATSSSLTGVYIGARHLWRLTQNL
jgi:PepSY-associated TM region